MGIGSSAVLLETEDGYICSRCRSEVSPQATACPHCGRNIELPAEPHPPGYRALITLSKIIGVSGPIISFGGFIFLDSQELGQQLALVGIAMVPTSIGLYLFTLIFWGFIYWLYSSIWS